ncbi:alpha/beta hydrolase [Mesorhizobium sp. M0410]|uniref:alpha/beta fold hydrolase n=1 Tax=Mesorhizobium sp. M0410 TaxID=2956943 RepID=UPI003339EAB9
MSSIGRRFDRKSSSVPPRLGLALAGCHPCLSPVVFSPTFCCRCLCCSPGRSPWASISPRHRLCGVCFVGKGHRQLASKLRSIAAESGLMLADALAGGRFTRYNDLLMPAGIIAGAGDRLFDAKAEALRLQSEIPGSFVDIIPQAGHMVHHTAPLAVLAMVDRVAAAASSEVGRHWRDPEEVESRFSEKIMLKSNR